MTQTVKFGKARCKRFVARKAFSLVVDMYPKQGRRIWPVRRAGVVVL